MRIRPDYTRSIRCTLGRHDRGDAEHGCQGAFTPLGAGRRRCCLCDCHDRRRTVTVYAHPGPAPIPGRKRCKVRHSGRMPARCKLARGHDGDCAFGWWRTGVQAVNLDAPLPKPCGGRSTGTEPEDARAGDAT